MEMEIQVMIPSPPVSTNATPYTTAPSTPHRFPNFYTAPTSPIHSLVAFQLDDDHDFAFNFDQHQQPPSITAADELFQGGKIKPLKPVFDDPPKARSHCKKKNLDSFDATFYQTPNDQTQSTQSSPKRGRKATRNTTRTRDKVSRSSSPFRISDILSNEDNNQKNSLTWYNKWNLKNLILFRSTSEGSARRKDVVNKYSRIMKGEEDVKISSFQRVDSCSSMVGTRKISAHEMHYTENRAVAEEMRRKTYLPYKSGLFGCLGYQNNGAPGGVHQISRGINSVIKQR